MTGRKAQFTTDLATPNLAHPALDASPMAVVAIDSGGTVVYANPVVERCFGWAPADLLGQAIEVLIPERLWEAHAAHRRGFGGAKMAHRGSHGLPSARPMGIGMTLVGRRRDGSEFPVEISLAPVSTDGGPVVFASIADITARTTLEAQLLQATKLESVGRLAGGIAHDFANMLFAIRGHAAVITANLDEGGGPDAASMRRSAEAIDDAIERASGLIRQLLAFSRRQVVRPEVVEPGAVIEALEPLLGRLVGASCTLEIVAGPGAGSFRIDPSQLDQVLVNLVVNARDAMPEGGIVAIETANVVFDEPYAIEHFEVTPGPYVMISVSDTGMGMDRETRQHIFEPFFTTKEAGRGSGLGLATVYGIVRQAAGHIWVYSEPGRGTTFKVYFPQATEGAGAPAAAEPGSGAASSSARTAATILLVEDEADVRSSTLAALERGGFTVLAPEDPRDALALVEAGTTAIDILVTDLGLPGVPGRDLVSRLLARRPGTPVVILSGHRPETAGVDDLRARGVVFASKPVTGSALLGAVDEAIRRAAVD